MRKYKQINLWGNAYQNCVLFVVNGNPWKFTDDIFIALSSLLKLNLEGAYKNILEYFTNKKNDWNSDIFKNINGMITNILQLSLDLCDPFHKLKLSETNFFPIEEPKNDDKEKNEEKVEVYEGCANESKNNEEKDKTKITNQIIKEIAKVNNLKVNDEEIEKYITGLLSKKVDVFSFNYDDIFARLMQTINEHSKKGPAVVLKELKKIYDFFSKLKQTSKIDLFHEDLLTPLEINFKFAIFSLKNGEDVAYVKDSNGSEQGKFEFFIERLNAQGEFIIYCVIRDWNKAFVNNNDIRKESDYDDNNTYKNLNKKDSVFQDYEFIKYKKCIVKWDDDKNHQEITYKKYKANGGRITLKERASNFEKSGTIVLCNLRESEDQKDTKQNVELEFKFFVSLHYDILAKKENNISDKKDDFESHGASKKKNKKRFLRCPYCAQKLEFNKLSIKSGRFCNGKKIKLYDIYDISKFSDEQKKGTLCRYNCYLNDDFIDKNGNISSEYVLPDDEKIKDSNKRPLPTNPLVLPPNYMKYNSGIISLIGMASSGKSVFISNLFGFNRGRIDLSGSDWQRTIAPFISNSIIVKFSPISKNLSDWKDKQQNEYEGIASATSYADYVSKLYSNIVKRTNEKKKTALMHLPFIMKMENTDNKVTNYLSFFDCPGECIYHRAQVNDVDGNRQLNTDENASLYPILNSDAYILCIDPNDDNEKSERDKLEEAGCILEKLTDKLGKDDIKGKKVIKGKAVLAVVFGKFDLFIEKLHNDSDDQTKEFLSKTCRMAPIERGKGHIDFKSSETERYIDECSKAIETYFSKKYEPQFENIMKYAKMFGNWKFFMVSALGRDSAIQKSKTNTDDTPMMLYRANSNYNVDIVIIWLSAQLDIIR